MVWYGIVYPSAAWSSSAPASMRNLGRMKRGGMKKEGIQFQVPFYYDEHGEIVICLFPPFSFPAFSFSREPHQREVAPHRREVQGRRAVERRLHHSLSLSLSSNQSHHVLSISVQTILLQLPIHIYIYIYIYCLEHRLVECRPGFVQQLDNV